MAMEHLNEALRRGAGNPSLLDTATGAISREAFTLRLEEATALAARLGHGVSVIVIEVLWPPVVVGRATSNQALDTVLAGIVDRIWAQARRSDTVARLDTARLGLLLPATHLDGARLYAVRLEPLLAEPYSAGATRTQPRLRFTTIGTSPGDTPDAAWMLAEIG